MIIEANSANFNKIELLSPSSVCDVTDLKLSINNPEQLIAEDDVDTQLSKTKIICVTSLDGLLMYSNFNILRHNAQIIEVMDLRSKKVHETIKSINRPNSDQIINTKILIHNHICLASVQEVRRPLLLTLQLVSENTETRKFYLIWTFKKLSISPAHQESDFTFSMNDESDKTFAFDRVNVLFAIDRSGRIVDRSSDLVSVFFGTNSDNHPKYIHDLVESFSDMLNIMTSYSDLDTSNKRLSLSALDLDLKAHDDFTIIYSSRERLLKNQNCVMDVRLYSPFFSNKFGVLFPLILKYSSKSDKREPDGQSENSDLLSFDKFRVLKKLSESNNSIIYKVIDPLIPNTIYLLKSLKVQESSESESIEFKFYNLYLNDGISCDFIEKPVKLFHRKDMFILMNYNPKVMDLFAFISKSSPICDDTVVKIFFQVTKAVEYLHDKGIIHRDIKEENILIDPENLNVKLIDFGSVLFKDEVQGHPANYVGTLSHAPLEILKGSPFNDSAQDIWCLGIVLYALCFKDLPFHSPKEIFEGIIKLPFERPDNIIKLIRLMLEPKPDKRPTIKDILSSDIFNKL